MPEPAQVLGHLEQVLAARRIDLLAQSDELPRSHSSPRATSAYVVPDFLCSSTAFCLNSGVYLGEGGGSIPAFNPPLLTSCETEISSSTGIGQIQIYSSEIN